MRISRVIIFLMLGFFVAQILFYYPNLPARMASHFDAAGKANDWMAKENFMIFEFVILLIIVSEFALLPVLIEKMPDALVNLPNKNFWLAAERRAKTFAVMRNYFDYFAVALLGLLIAINQMIFKANINRTNLPPATMWTILGAFLLFTIVWMIKFTRQFKITKL